MKWLSSRVYDDPKYQIEKRVMEEQINEWLKKYDVRKRESGYEPQITVDAFLKAYSNGLIREGYGDALDSFMKNTDREYIRYTYDPKYPLIIEKLKRLHDSYIGRIIGIYERATDEELEAQKKKEIELYNTLIDRLNREQVATEGLPTYSLDDSIEEFVRGRNDAMYSAKINEGIPGDKLYCYASNIQNNFKNGFPKNWYNELMRRLDTKLNHLYSLDARQYKEEKKDELKVKMIGFH